MQDKTDEEEERKDGEEEGRERKRRDDENMKPEHGDVNDVKSEREIDQAKVNKARNRVNSEWQITRRRVTKCLRVHTPSSVGSPDGSTVPNTIDC